MAVNNQDQQAAFIDMMREGFVLSAEDITAIFTVLNPAKYVQLVRDRTGLDIHQGKRLMDGVTTRLLDVYYMTQDIDPSCPGLDEMEEPVIPIDSIIKDPEIIEYQNGYYLMWVCPNTFGSGDCGQFHKTDLGDEELQGPIFVRCIKCGTTYQILHKEN